MSGDLGSLALAHNGNLVNVPRLQRRGRDARHQAAHVDRLGADRAPHRQRRPATTWLDRVRAVLPRLEGAYCLVLLTRDRVYVARDPLGIRPLALGRLEGGGWVAASESVRSRYGSGAPSSARSQPGELLEITAEGIHAEQPAASAVAGGVLVRVASTSHDRTASSTAHLVYAHARAHGRRARRRAPGRGRLRDARTRLGDARRDRLRPRRRLPYREGLVKNRYIGRTFIQPNQDQREVGVDLKFNPLPEVLRGQRIVLVDDSIVRGTTTPRIVAMLRRAGAAEVHLRICAATDAVRLPPGRRHGARVLAHRQPPQRRGDPELVGADSLGYLSLDGLVHAIGMPANELCNACFHGNYPMSIAQTTEKLALEQPLG